MKIRFRENVSRILIIAFILFLFPSDSFTVPQSEKEGLKKIKEAEKLFIKYKYRNAINKYIEAEKIVKSGKNLSRLYIGLSKSYYALGLEAKSREVIRKIADLTIQSKVDEDKLPRGYLKIYKEILAQIKKDKEESKIVKTEEKITELKPETFAKETEKPKKQVIEKPGKKKKKKKSSIFPIIGGALALGAVAFLLTGKKDPGGDTASNTASIHIESTPTGADVYVDGASKGVTTPCDITVSEGSRAIRVVIDGWGETTKTQTFSKDQNYNLNAKLASYQYEFLNSFSIMPSSGKYYGAAYCISLDNENNIYFAEINFNDYSDHLLKFDSSGNQLSDVPLSNSYGHQIKVDNQLLYTWSRSSYQYSSNNIQKYNLDGSYISKFLKGVPYIGGFDIYARQPYILINGKKINYYYTSGTLISSFSVNLTDNDSGIYIPDNGNYIYIPGSKVGGNRISKYDISSYNTVGNFIKSWNSEQGEVFVPKLITGFGSGETEKIFIISYLDLRISLNVYSAEGEFLTRYSYQTNTVGSFYNNSIMVGTDGIVYWQRSSTVSKYSTSDSTEGSGAWTVVSKLKRSDTKGSLNGFNNSLRLQKRVDRNSIKKELKDKKEGKKIR